MRRHLTSLVGFPVREGYRFALGGRRYRVRSSGVQTIRTLIEFRDHCSMRLDPSWALRARKQIRTIQNRDVHAVLSLVVDRTQDPIFRILAIWLRGRCRGSLGTSVIAGFCNHPDGRTRKEVARALRRMSAWRELEAMAHGDDDPRIRRIATVRVPHAFVARMSNFTHHLARRHTTTEKRQLFVSPELDLHQGRPPKTSTMIRTILERIRRVLAGIVE